MNKELEQTLTRYLAAVVDGRASLFVGAGLSIQSGHIDWASLLQFPASQLGIQITATDNLPQIATWFVQNSNGNRQALIRHVIDNIGLRNVPSHAHKLVAQLPISHIWTTNYDDLIETALHEAGFAPAIIRRDDDLTCISSGCSHIVYKMHGDLTDPTQIIITSNDYEKYPASHPFLQHKLTSSLIDSTFLFVGFSLDDYNLKRILGYIAHENQTIPHEHFAIFKNELGSGEKAARFALKMADLRTFNITPLLVSDYEEINEILGHINERAPRPSLRLSSQVARNQFVTDKLQELNNDRSPIRIAVSAIFSSFGISDSPQYWQNEPLRDESYKTQLLLERDLFLQLAKKQDVQLRVLLHPPTIARSSDLVRYLAVKDWIVSVLEEPRIDVRICSIQFFQNSLIVNGRFCLVSDYKPGCGYVESALYRSAVDVDRHLKHFDSRFNGELIASTKHQAIFFYDRVIGNLRDEAHEGKRELVHQWHNYSLIRQAFPNSDGGLLEYTFIKHPGSVIILVVANNRDALIVTEDRCVIGARSSELPAGGIEPDEKPLEAAKRELQEETGIDSSSVILTPVPHFYPSNSVTDEVFFGFEVAVARRTDLTIKDSSTYATCNWIPIERLSEMIAEGGITDAATIVMLLRYVARRMRTSRKRK